MRRLALVLCLAALVGAAAAPAATLPSHTTPNAPGSIATPFALSSPPPFPAQRSYAELAKLWHRAGAAYGIPWQVLGAINQIESNFGQNMGPSSAGAVGWMQFMPETWARWGMDGDGDGVADPWNPEDAVYAAARYLAAAGAHDDLYRAVYAYNHAHWYVRDVLELAATFGDAGPVALPLAAPAPSPVFDVDELEERLAQGRRGVTRAKRALVAAERRAERLVWAVEEAKQRAGDPDLTDAEFAAVEAEVTRLALERDAAADAAEELGRELAEAVAALDAVRAEGTVVAASRPLERTVAAAASAGGHVFPVGGGPDTVFVGYDHHDYPAADIAAPEGAPVYALADAVVVDTWPSPSGRCGIGLQLRTDAGVEYVYCHLAYLEPAVVPGSALAAGAAVGLVGSTGNSSGPHLHLQYVPATAYPQDESWFQALAGVAFSWRGTPREDGPNRVFTVVAVTR